MRTNRLLEMIYLLLNDRQQTAEELAGHFDVSIKTIYRDVDTLAAAGIPISKQQGVNGGVVLSEDYTINKSKLTASEEAALMIALEGIKKLPNAQLEYALKLMKQYFNEAGTLWINTDDVSLDIQDKFHQLKRATIEKNIIEFQYFIDGEFLNYKAEPYELRITSDVWKVLIRRIREKSFEEVYLSRMTDIEIKSQHFSRREIPDDFGKKNGGPTKVIRFDVKELTDRLLNRYPIEDFDFAEGHTYLNLKVKHGEDISNIVDQFQELKSAERNV